MIRYLLAGLALFLGFAVAFAPAGLLERALETNTEASLLNPRGTLWRGQGTLLVDARDMGTLNWDFHALSLLQLSPSYAWTLAGADKNLSGDVEVGWRNAGASVAGQLEASALNAWLSTYDIFLSGQFNFRPTVVGFDHRRNEVHTLDGELEWSGGPVRYTLSGLLRETTLPPLTAILNASAAGQPQAVVYARGEQTPLLIATLSNNGFAKVSITKFFTKLLGNPWPGSDADHEVVIEVEEQIF